MCAWRQLVHGTTGPTSGASSELRVHSSCGQVCVFIPCRGFDRCESRGLHYDDRDVAAAGRQAACEQTRIRKPTDREKRNQLTSTTQKCSEASGPSRWTCRPKSRPLTRCMRSSHNPSSHEPTLTPARRTNAGKFTEGDLTISKEGMMISSPALSFTAQGSSGCAILMCCSVMTRYRRARPFFPRSNATPLGILEDAPRVRGTALR